MDCQDDNIPTCPFCSFSDSDAHFVAEHVEFCHPANAERPVDDEVDLSEGFGEKYVECPHGCGELIVNTDLSTHHDLHFAEGIALEDAGAPKTETRSLGLDAQKLNGSLEDGETLESYASLEDRQIIKDKPSHGRLPHTSCSLDPSVGGVRRLGRAELGPYAHEKRMPTWLRKLLEKGANTSQSNQISPDGRLMKCETVGNEITNVIPTLVQLCEQDKSVQRAFFCSPKVSQIFRMPREGGFCGYRNIQMLISYIKESQSPGYEHFPGRVPTILELQDMIEQAWDMGFNSSGRVETGGIRGTRKYIGTSEAQALFLSVGILCEANSFTETKERRAYDALHMNVAAYFQPALSLDGKGKVIVTDLPPIYFQHQGHSLTIVGFEVRDDGNAGLLVFDPMFKTTPAIKRLLGTTARSRDPARLLKAYRRGAAYLQKYKAFEILKLSSSKPLSEP